MSQNANNCVVVVPYTTVYYGKLCLLPDQQTPTLFSGRYCFYYWFIDVLTSYLHLQAEYQRNLSNI